MRGLLVLKWLHALRFSDCKALEGKVLMSSERVHKAR